MYIYMVRTSAIFFTRAPPYILYKQRAIYSGSRTSALSDTTCIIIAPARRHIHCTATHGIFRRPHEETSALCGTMCIIIAGSERPSGYLIRLQRRRERKHPQGAPSCIRLVYGFRTFNSSMWGSLRLAPIILYGTWSSAGRHRHYTSVRDIFRWPHENICATPLDLPRAFLHFPHNAQARLSSCMS